ncbi:MULTISPECIES: hypothetical protein [unclassified Haloparvum]|uniref:hypothetical protein n=1 Tax=Haloparvum sp. PAK95 TaxID=3418962 RepID=UPI003D2ECEAE
MGLFSRLFGRNGDSNPESKNDPEPDIVIEDSLDSEFIPGKFRGERVTFSSVSSPNGGWRCLYGRSGITGGAPIVVTSGDGEVQHAFTVTRAQAVAVADTGHVAVTDIGEPDDQDLGGTLDVVGPDGQPNIEFEFDANIWECAITDNGQYASTATHNPDRSVYIFDVESGDLITKFETPDLNSPAQEFGEIDGEIALYLIDEDEPYRGIDLDGNTVWKSQSLKKQDRINELLDSSDEAGLEEAIELLEEAYELVDDQNRKKSIANKLADAHWDLSKEIRKEDGDTDAWWSHLNQAKQYYYEIVSWHDGRKGVAKVERKQAKYHLKKDDEETALQLLQSISALEEKFDVQLLTDADKDKIEKLS